MKKVLGRSLLHCKELETVATEVEKLVNSRPLTHIDGDDEPSECPLTPAMLYWRLLGRVSIRLHRREGEKCLSQI